MPTPLTPLVAPTGSTPEITKMISGINDTIGKINTNASTGATTGTTTPPPSTTAITADTLNTNQKPPVVVAPSPVAGSAGLASTLTETAKSNMATDDYTAGLDAAKNSTEASKNKSFSDYISNLLGNKGQTELTADEYANTGVDQAQADLRDINQKIIAEQHSNLREIQALKENAAGYVGSGLSDKIQEVQDKSTSRQADMAILQLASQGKYDSAKAIADRAVAVKFERQKTINEALQLNYTENKDLFTKAEQRQFETAQADRNRKLDMDVYKERAKYDEMIKQSDPLYNANLANVYSQISARQSEAGTTLNGKPQSAIQAQVQGYADRTNQADVIINNLGSAGTDAKDSFYGGIPYIGNYLTSNKYQQLQQAQNNFVNAVLRRESGAAISSSEFASAAKQYFPQPGDSKETIQQKTVNRQTTIDNLFQQSNIRRSVLPGQVIESNGKQYQVGEDGVSLTEL